MLTRVIKVVMLVGLVAIVAYAGVCVYGNLKAANPTVADQPKTPTPKLAAYAVTIENTGRVLFTNAHERFGAIHILHGYWEIVGLEYVYRGRDLPLDEGIWGKITVTERR